MEKINITGVPETMLHILYARASYSKRPEHKFYDAKAVEMISRMAKCTVHGSGISGCCPICYRAKWYSDRCFVCGKK